MNEQVLEAVVDTILTRVAAAGVAGVTRDDVFGAVKANITVERFEQTLEELARANIIRRGKGAYVLFPAAKLELLKPPHDCGPLCPTHGDQRDSSIAIIGAQL